jgi:hypothetical protein
LTIHREALAGRKFDCLFIGASNGGSLHLADIMHVPILGSGVNILVSRESDPDDVKGFVEFGRSIAEGFLSINKHIEVVIHIDPIHDRMNLTKVFHFRVKFWLPDAYRTFIREIEEERPSRRFDDEFGNSPEMATEMKEFAQDEGFNFTHVKVKKSHDLSALCTYLIHTAMMDKKIRPKGVILEQYTQCVPLAVRRLALLPVWTYFVSRTSFNDARRMLDIVFGEYLDEAEELIFLPTQPLNPSPLGDYVTFKEWEQLLHKYPVRKLDILTNRELYPLDTASLVAGPLEVFKRCQGKRDMGLDITLQDVIDGCRKFL